eukprot:5421528-Pleurochrysis_carterae.AAC.3
MAADSRRASGKERLSHLISFFMRLRPAFSLLETALEYPPCCHASPRQGLSQLLSILEFVALSWHAAGVFLAFNAAVRVSEVLLLVF